jgi:hypothetical protein
VSGPGLSAELPHDIRTGMLCILLVMKVLKEIAHNKNHILLVIADCVLKINIT